MSPRFNFSLFLAVGVLCAAGGIGAGAVATATASSTSSTAKTAHHAKAHAGKGHGKHAFGRDLEKVAGHAASGSVVVHTKDGYKTITFEHGTVDSVNGDQLTISEGAQKGGSTSGLKQATITVPSTAKVRDNRKQSSLSSLTAGQRVTIVQTPKRMVVRARTPKQHTAS